MKKTAPTRVPSESSNVFASFRLPARAALATLAFAVFPSVRAADISWDATDPGLFTTAENWDSDVVPGADDNAIIANGGESQIGTDDSITLTNLEIFDGIVTQTGGSLTASGTGDAPSAFYIGGAAGLTGTYAISGESVVQGAKVRIGDNGGTGIVNLSGQSNFLGATGNITRIGQGEGSTGTLSVSDQAQWLTDDWMIVGSGGSGTLNLSGTTASLTANGNFYLGEGSTSTGTANVSGTATLNAGQTEVGRGGATGTLVVKDDATMNTNGVLVVGSNGGTGKVTFQDGATVKTTADLWVANESDSVGTVDIKGDSTNVNIDSWVVIGRNGGTGTVTLEGNATLTKSGPGDRHFAIGDANVRGSTGTFTIKDTATLDVASGELWVGAEGDGSGVGVMNVEGGTVNTNNWVAIGRNHNSGTLNISGGTFNVNATGTYGVEGSAFFTSEGSATANAVINQSGGEFNALATETFLGESNGSVAVWNATGGVSNHNVLRLGLHSGATGTMNISGTAVVNAAKIYVSSDGGSTGALNLNGGTLNAGHIEAGAGNHTIAFNGGQLNATADDGNFIRDFHTGDVDLQAGGLHINTGAFVVGISTQLSGDGGITKTGAGTLIMQLPSDGPQDANTYAGATVVSEGTLEAFNTNLGIGDVQVADGAHLVLDLNTSIADASNLFLDGSASTLNLAFASGDSEVIGGLLVNGQAVEIGTYTASDLNTMFDGQFSGDGSITVTSVIPEPSAMALVIGGLGGAVFLLRRRRTA